ncbi:MAG: family 78 glycoside hydrolase catalytic domain [Chloroflexota bacterium]
MSPPQPEATPAVTVVDVRCQVPRGVLAMGRDPVRLTWRVEPAFDGLTQEAYEVEASGAADFSAVTAASGVVDSPDQVGVPDPGRPLMSREVRFYRVRVGVAGRWSDWGPVLRVEAGLLEGADWQADAVTLEDDPGAEGPSPAPFIRGEFEVAGAIESARLYVTSLGVHRVAINGRPVSDDLLAPGWTPYDRRLIVETYDVTALLAAGQNVVAAALGDGWYRGRLGWEDGGARATYGRQVGLIAQLEIRLADGMVQRVVSDGSWRAATGEIIAADLYDGAIVDFRERRSGWMLPGFDARAWEPAATVPFDASLLEPRVAPPVRVVAILPASIVRRTPGSVVLDSGQNVAGYVRLRVRGEPGTEVEVRHAEVLEPDGSLHVRSLRSARATDRYVLADRDEIELEPPFTFHGFRYAEVATSAEVLSAEILAISSDTPPRATFSSSDIHLNRLHANAAWSQRGNFVSIPTDCPQRDERLGWTGDAQAFAPTASTLFDSAAFWQSWLRDLDLEQDDELGVPSVVPDVVLAGEPRFGRAGWADAATIVPWAVYDSYGDATILRRQLPSMRRWVHSLVARRGDDGLLPDAMQFGDWLDPDAPSDQPWLAKANSTFLANAFFAHSARLLGDAAGVLGETVLSRESHELAATVARLTWDRWREHALTTQTGCAAALQLGIAPEGERAEVADVLAGLVRDGEGRVATGFLGTPLVLPALASAERFDEAYLMLLRREPPSWLYQVAQGATTIWERWDAIRPDGSIHPGRMAPPPGMPPSSNGDGGHMLSFNHYAYGAVIDWVYRFVAGVAPGSPGYRHVVFAPRPAVGIDHAQASVQSPYGTVEVAWRLAPDVLTIELALPFGTTGEVRPPMASDSSLTVDGRSSAAPAGIGQGRHVIVVTRPRVAGRDLRRPSAPATV